MRFRHPAGGTLHLAYCSNVHPAEDVDGIIDQLERYAGAVRERLGADSLGVGLWLSHLAVDEPGAGERLREALRRLKLEVVTLNGFPYRAFQAPVVKLGVYRPSWADPRRRYYTLGLVQLLDSIMPDDVEEGSISTLPLGWRTEWSDSAQAAARDALACVANELERLHARTGRRIRLALEPEPGCTIETVRQAAEFLAGLAPEWIGICLDACHLAVQFEEPEEAVKVLADAGVPVVKAQISSALRVDEPGSAAGQELLRHFNEPRFMHQVRERVNGHVEGADDLPDALAGGLPGEHEWRVHFHVPVNDAEHTTQAELERTLERLIAPEGAPATRHFEVETYTWNVMPGREHGEEDLVEGIARELDWTRQRFLEHGAEVVA
ncbi:MAG TPA: metabolite traffic protein EboE [Solirubrobacterales bacterium]